MRTVAPGASKWFAPGAVFLKKGVSPASLRVTPPESAAESAPLAKFGDGAEPYGTLGATRGTSALLQCGGPFEAVRSMSTPIGVGPQASDSCVCGHVHRVPIDAVVIDDAAIDYLVAYAQRRHWASPFVVMDANTQEVAGRGSSTRS